MEIEVVVNEKLDRSTCAALLTETIKYLLFHRFQIPSPFDQLKTEDERDRLKEEPSGKPLPSTVKKKRQLIADIDQLLLNIFNLFLQVNITDVLLLLGATVVNPKEVYSIKCSTLERLDEADRSNSVNLAGKENGLASRSKFVDKCCRILSRTLFTDPTLNSCTELQCTSIHCFILAPRDAEVAWFKPKASFKIPRKGTFYSIDIQGESTPVGETDDIREHGQSEETLWFQSPLVLKGYKEVYRETRESGLWSKQ